MEKWLKYHVKAYICIFTLHWSHCEVWRSLEVTGNLVKRAKNHIFCEKKFEKNIFSNSSDIDLTMSKT